MGVGQSPTPKRLRQMKTMRIRIQRAATRFPHQMGTHASPVVDIQCLFMDLQGFNLLPTDNKIVCQQLVSSSKATASVHPFPLIDCEQPPRNHGNHNGVEEVGDKCSLNAV